MFLAFAASEELGSLVQIIISLKVVSVEYHVDSQFDFLRIVSRRYHILENQLRSAWNSEWLFQEVCNSTPMLARFLICRP